MLNETGRQKTFKLLHVQTVSNTNCFLVEFVKSMNPHFSYFISGIPRVIQCKFRLPLKLICLPGQPSKTASHKLTIDTNKSPVSLLSLFPGRTFEVTCL